MTVLRFEWLGGYVEFDQSDAAQVQTVKNRKQLLKQFQNRKYMVYSKSDIWRSIVISSYSLEKLELIRSAVGKVNFYHDYANSPSEYITVSVDRNFKALYRSGYQDAEELLSLKLIEAEKIDPFAFSNDAGIVQEVIV